MPSLLPGFDYDIFISYRHNDNRSGWVTDFVSALQEELAATIKEPLSIYFDKNPHDGILETDNVDKSLEGKLKCLIFIPIISQTYCDPKSFAWQFEFCAFNKLSQQDKLGRDIKLGNGNVTSRILPVKIHDLDPEDKAAIENEIGGVLRAVEFIFKSTGVNRPLRPQEEHPQDNLNKTFYRDQVNKVANAIKSIIQAVKATSNVQASQPITGIPQSDRPERQTVSRKLIFAAIVLLAAIALAFWQYNSKRTEPQTTTATADKSLVVLPFQDMSPKKDQEWFSDGLTEELLNSLSAVEDLKLISRTTSFSFKDKGLSAKRIADSLGVAHVLEGSVRKSDDQLRVTVQLIKAQDDTHLWSHVYEYTIDSVFRIQGDISKNVASALNILLDAKTREDMNNVGTTNVEAYQEYLKGKALYNQSHLTGDIDLLTEANKFFEKAISIYPNFAEAYYDHADVFSHSLLGAMELKSLGLSEKDKYDKMMNDLDRAISLSQVPNDKVGYSFTRDFFSNDWSRLAAYIDVKENWDSGWEVFLALIDPDFAVRRYLKVIAIDPHADMQRYWAAMGLVHKGELDSALLLYKTEHAKSNVNAWVKSDLLFRKGDYSKALQVANSVDFGNDLDGYLLFLQLLSGQQMESRAELDRALARQPLVDPFGYSPILLYNALGEYQRADSIAALIDKRLLGHCGLAMNFLNYGLYFHLSATPNFAARLREFGINTEAFEKKNYTKIRPIKVGKLP